MSRERGPYCQNVDMSNTVLVVEGVELLVQREVLSCMSPYFETLLTGSFKESQQTRIELKELSLPTFCDCLDIIHGRYLDCMPGKMAFDRLSDLLIYADRLDIDVVRRFCEIEMYFHCEGQEIDRYLLACHFSLDQRIKDRLLEFVSGKLEAWTSAAVERDEMMSLRPSDLAALVAASNNWTSRRVSFSSAQPREQSNEDIEALRKYGQCNVTLTVESKWISLDRNVIVFYSPYFRKLIENDGGTTVRTGVPATPVKNHVVVLDKEVKANALIDCLDVLYGKSLSDYSPGNMSLERIYNLLYLSYFLQLRPVVIFCFTELLLPKEGYEVYHYLMACHFQLKACKWRLLVTLTESMFQKCDVKKLSSWMGIDTIHLGIDDIRSILAIMTAGDGAIYSDRNQKSSGVQEAEAKFSVKTSDIVLVVGKCEFEVNRMVLATHSTYFYDLLVEKGIEKNRFELEKVDPDVFALCLKILHCQVPSDCRKGGIPYLFETLECAHRFDMNHVKMFCDLEMWHYKGGEWEEFFVACNWFPEKAEVLRSKLNTNNMMDWMSRIPTDYGQSVPVPVKLPLQHFHYILTICRVGRDPRPRPFLSQPYCAIGPL